MMMPYAKVILILCTVAALSGFLLNFAQWLLLHLMSQFMGGGGAVFGATRTGWTIMLFAWWTASFFVGVRLAIMLKAFPFAIPK